MAFLLFWSRLSYPLCEEPAPFNSFEGCSVVRADRPWLSVVMCVQCPRGVTVLALVGGSGFVAGSNPARRWAPRGPWAQWKVPEFPRCGCHSWTAVARRACPGRRRGVRAPCSGCCSQRQDRAAALNLLSWFGRGGAALWMQNFPLHLSSHGFTCSAKLLHALTTGLGGKGVRRVVSLWERQRCSERPDVWILLWPMLAECLQKPVHKSSSFGWMSGWREGRGKSSREL